MQACSHGECDDVAPRVPRDSRCAPFGYPALICSFGGGCAAGSDIAHSAECGRVVGLVSICAVRPCTTANKFAFWVVVADVAPQVFFVGSRSARPTFAFTFEATCARLVQLMRWSPSIAMAIRVARQGGALLARLPRPEWPCAGVGHRDSKHLLGHQPFLASSCHRCMSPETKTKNVARQEDQLITMLSRQGALGSTNRS